MVTVIKIIESINKHAHNNNTQIVYVLWTVQNDLKKCNCKI